MSYQVDHLVRNDQKVILLIVRMSGPCTSPVQVEGRALWMAQETKMWTAIECKYNVVVVVIIRGKLTYARPSMAVRNYRTISSVLLKQSRYPVPQLLPVITKSFL